MRYCSWRFLKINAPIGFLLILSSKKISFIIKYFVSLREYESILVVVHALRLCSYARERAFLKEY